MRARLTSGSEEEIAEQSETLEPRVYDELEVVADQDSELGVEPTFELAGERHSSHIRARNLEALQILADLTKMEPTDFERFCALLLNTIGADARHVGRTADGGVDFVATDVPIGIRYGVAFRKGAPLVIGQAKRYKAANLVTENELRDFLGGAMLKADELRRSQERFGLFTPVVYAFWTTSQLNEKALQFARKAGIWTLGGLSLAQVSSRLGIAPVSVHVLEGASPGSAESC